MWQHGVSYLLFPYISFNSVAVKDWAHPTCLCLLECDLFFNVKKPYTLLSGALWSPQNSSWSFAQNTYGLKYHLCKISTMKSVLNNQKMTFEAKWLLKKGGP